MVFAFFAFGNFVPVNFFTVKVLTSMDTSIMQRLPRTLSYLLATLINSFKVFNVLKFFQRNYFVDGLISPIRISECSFNSPF